MRRILAALAILIVFIALNHGAYDGFFQDDELDNLSWAPLVPAATFVTSLVSPRFDVNNFRPVGHAYFAILGRAIGLNFPPWITPVFALHFLNAALLYALMRRLKIEPWHALIGCAFFLLSAAAMDAYWKPMYVFDLLCSTFSLACLLLWDRGRWILSFLAWWLAYKSKELAVMLPFVLLAYEYWFGKRRWLTLAPFFIAALSFGIQGLLFNPNKDNDYTFRFTAVALERTLPFYAGRFLLIPWSGLLLLPLLLLRDRRVWFGLLAAGCLLFTLLFLPGRLFEAYTYLPLAAVTIAITAAATRVQPLWFAAAVCLWMPWNIRDLRHEQGAILAADDQAFAFEDAVAKWSRQHPETRTFVYEAMPGAYHSWGMAAAWNLAHRTLQLPVFSSDSPEGRQALTAQTVAFGTVEPKAGTYKIVLHQP